jgi:hypothetical protein
MADLQKQLKWQARMKVSTNVNTKKMKSGNNYYQVLLKAHQSSSCVAGDSSKNLKKQSFNTKSCSKYIKTAVLLLVIQART